ncbi:MAG: ornithine cyclodeaminase family protein [Pseudomonadota bacterium]
MKPIYLDDATISGLLDYPRVVAILNESFADLAAGKAEIHARQRTDSGNLRLSTMGALWNARQVGGVKVYPTVSGQFSFLLILFDLQNNRPIAVLDGAEITKFRTAGLTALIASRSATQRVKKLALFGAGFQGRAQAQALCENFKFDEICVVDPLADDAWCSRLAAQTGSRVNRCSPQVATVDADIVVTATRSQIPVFDGNWLKPGAFVSAVGISAPKGRELDDATLSRANRIIVEWKPQSLREAGELVLWQTDNALEREKIMDLPELYRQSEPWRGSEEDIIVAKSVGVGLSDVACAYLAFTRSQKMQETQVQGVAA